METPGALVWLSPERLRFHGRSRGPFRPGTTGIPAPLRGVLLWLPLTLTLFAGVTYDQTDRTGKLDGSMLLQSRVPSIDPPVFDVSSDLYAPPLKGIRPVGFRMLLEGDRLLRVGKDFTTIYDLKERTVTTMQPKAHSYSIEGLDKVQQRVSAQLQDWSGPWTTATYTTETQKTGQTRQIEGQTAEEYRIIAITMFHGKRSVGGSSVYWMAPKPPSDELAAFQLRWSRECGLPFPGMPATPANGDTSVFGTMANAASKLPGYPVLYVVESRPLPGAERFAGPAVADATSNSLLAAESQGVSPSLLLRIWVHETAFSGFAAGAVDASAFVVPAGYKMKKIFRLMPD